MECREQLNKWLALVSPTYGLQPETLTYASSDAGFRQYFRIQGTGRSYIIMDCPKEKQSMKEFVKVDEIMMTAGLNVPEIFEVDFEGGFMLLSDLGTKTYLDVLDHDNADRLMDDATTALVKLQVASKPDVLPPYSAELLRKEINLFTEWFLEKHLHMELSELEKKLLERTFDLIIAKNLSEAKVYVHRDYMPRNLMPESVDNPGVLDFQDAVYGPISYDIASLCRDAFISWEEHQIIDWTIRYWDKARKAGLSVPADFGAFWKDVELMGLQRHLKVLGIFCRLSYRDGKDKYIGDLPRFINYVSKTAGRYDALKPLANLMDKIQNKEKQVGYTF